jgi:cell division septum initiation protein DivIVA
LPGKGDYFRTVSFGGFHKEDVLLYIEQRETELAALRTQSAELAQTLHEQKKQIAELRQNLREEAAQAKSAIAAAQEAAFAAEQENGRLRDELAISRQGVPTEEGLPLEQLTIERILRGLLEET